MKRMALLLIGVVAVLLLALGCGGDSGTGPDNDGEDATYTVQGNVQDSEGNGMAGFTVQLAGADTDGSPVTKNTTTDASGSYSLAGIPNGSYIITMSKDGYTCTPSTRAVSVNGGNATVAAFTAADSGGNGGDGDTYSISGTVTDMLGNGIPDVTVRVDVAGDPVQDMTDSQGNYTITGVSGGNYVVWATKDGYVFAPEFHNVTITTVNQHNINFAGSSGSGDGGEDGDNTISGKVLDGAGAAIEGVTIRLTGASVLTAFTNDSGEFSFTNMPNGSYTITPSKSGYTFTPETKLSLVNESNSTDNLFVGSSGASNSNRITGRVVDEYGVGVPDADMVISRGMMDQKYTKTDQDGYYLFEDFENGYWVVLVDHDSYDIDNPSITISVSNEQKVVDDFSGPYIGYTSDISGTIRDNWGGVLEGVAVTVHHGTMETTVTSDEDGEYRFEDIPAEWTYNITASLFGYTFTPDPLVVTFSDSDIYDADLTGSSGEGYLVSGSITGDDSESYSGVEITLVSADYTLTVTTDAQGAYSISVPNGTYILTPEKEGFSFTPETLEITVAGQDVPVAAFASLPAGPFTISGRIVDAEGNGVIAGVMAYREGVAMAVAAIGSDIDGYFTLESNNLINGTYRVEPFRDNFTFTPESRTCIIQGANVTVDDFVATAN